MRRRLVVGRPAEGIPPLVNRAVCPDKRVERTPAPTVVAAASTMAKHINGHYGAWCYLPHHGCSGCEHNGEAHHRFIDPDRVQVGQTGRILRPECDRTPNREGDTDGAAHDSQESTPRKRLHEEASRRRTERQPDRVFPRPRGAARHREADNIGPGSGQKQHGRSEQQPERRSGHSHQLSVQLHGPNPTILGEGFGGRESPHDPRQFGGGISVSASGLQARHDIECGARPRASRLQFPQGLECEPHRRPDVGVPAEAVETRIRKAEAIASDTHYFVGQGIEHYLPPHDRCRASIALVPESVADDGDRAPVVAGAERTTERERARHRGEEPVRHHDSTNAH